MSVPVCTEPARVPSIDALRGLGGRDPYGALGSSFSVGVWRSAGFSLAVVWLALRLRRLGLGPRL
jgi:hypothetical protein